MVAGGVHDAPYAAVRALAIWANYREGYLRGRLILLGERWERLDLRERFDVVEAVLAEGHPVDKILDALWEQVIRIFADEETFGLTPEAEAGMRAAEAEFKQADPLTPEQRAERERRSAEREAAREAQAMTESPP